MPTCVCAWPFSFYGYSILGSMTDFLEWPSLSIILISFISCMTGGSGLELFCSLSLFGSLLLDPGHLAGFYHNLTSGDTTCIEICPNLWSVVVQHAKWCPLLLHCSHTTQFIPPCCDCLSSVLTAIWNHIAKYRQPHTFNVVRGVLGCYYSSTIHSL